MLFPPFELFATFVHICVCDATFPAFVAIQYQKYIRGTNLRWGHVLAQGLKEDGVAICRNRLPSPNRSTLTAKLALFLSRAVSEVRAS